MKLPTELDILAEEQAQEQEDDKPPKRRHGRKLGQAPMFRRFKKEAKKQAPPPAWMSDPSLLPKRPPGRSP